MNMKKITINFWAKLLSVALTVSLAGGYVCNTSVVKAETINTDIEVSAGENEPTTTDPDAYTLVAHRGYSGYAPFNSMPAFEMAVAAGFDTIELDIRRCKPEADGSVKWVISHDDSLLKTMGVDVNISDLTYSQILQYSYTKGNRVEDYNNLKIATLDEVIELMKKTKAEGKKITWQIEFKNTSDTNYTNYFENEVIKPLLEADVMDCVIFSSFTSAYMKKIKDINSSYRTWYLTTVLNESAISAAKKCQAEGISFKGSVSTTTKTNVEAAIAQGFRVGTYTVNSPVVMGVYYQWGVRNFATDEIAPIDLHKDTLTGTYNVKTFTVDLSKTSYVYNGAERLPNVTVSYKGMELVEGLNYKLRYEKNKNPGTATVYVTGLNNCIDEKTASFKITMPEVKDFKITKSKVNYVKMSWKQVDNVTGYIVYSYNFTTKKYEEVKIVTNPAQVTCKVKKLQSATKYKFRVKAYVDVDGKRYLTDATQAIKTYTKPAKATIKSLTRYKGYKRLRIKWNAVSGCTGYEVKIATDKNMKNVIGTYNVKGGNALKLKVKKLSKKKKYYVKVRAYLKDGNTTYYGAYSDVKKSKGKPKKK